MNHFKLMITVFVEQPLAMPWSDKKNYEILVIVLHKGYIFKTKTVNFL